MHFSNIINNAKWSRVIWVNRNDGILVAFWWGCGCALLVVVMRKACMCRWAASRSQTGKIFLPLSSTHLLVPILPLYTYTHTHTHTHIHRRAVFCSLVYSAHETDVQEYTHIHHIQSNTQNKVFPWDEHVKGSITPPSASAGCFCLHICTCRHDAFSQNTNLYPNLTFLLKILRSVSCVAHTNTHKCYDIRVCFPVHCPAFTIQVACEYVCFTYVFAYALACVCLCICTGLRVYHVACSMSPWLLQIPVSIMKPRAN